MPKIYISYPTSAFSQAALDSLAEELTTIGLECEKLSDTPYVRSNIWVYANEYAAEKVFHGGKAGGTKVISFEVNCIEGALDAEAKANMIARFTEAVKTHTELSPSERAPVFVLIRDVPAENWGMFGKPVTLDGVRNPPADAKPV